MNQNRWILPEGIDELLPSDAAALELLRREITDLYFSWGYELVMPPVIEYLDSLLTGTGNESDLQTFKIVDQLNGRTMGVRSDMTPQVARIDAHRLTGKGVSRLFYMGTTLKTRPEGLSGNRSPLQLGAEIYGHAGAQSDAEVINLMLTTLKHCSDREIYLDMGHVGIFRGLSRLAGFSEVQESSLFDMVQRKSVPEIRAFVAESVSDKSLANMLNALVELSGGLETLDRATALFSEADDAVQGALNELREITGQLQARDASLRIHFDLSELRGYSYHTGVVFAAYVDVQGQEIARGGRYDDIGQCFGRSRPATGFSTDLKQLARLTSENKKEQTVATAIYVPDTGKPGVWEEIQRLRTAGEVVVCALSDSVPQSETIGFNRQLVEENGTWILKDYTHG